MSATLAAPYRGFAVTYSHAEKPNDHDLMTYDEAHSQPRDRLLSGLSYHSQDANASHFGHMQAVLPPLPEPHPTGHHEVHPTLASGHQLLHPHPYNYDISYPSESRKRSRSGSDGGHHHQIDRNMVPPQPTHLMPLDGPGSAPEGDMLFPIQTDHSASHVSSAHSYASPMSLSLPLPVPLPILQQHHHHRLPAQANLRDRPNVQGPPCMVGQPGMPPPAPRPSGPKLKFTPREDSLLVELKEDKNLAWRQVADFFPGRTSGTLQVRYCTKLKAKDVVWTDEMVERLQHAMKAYQVDRWRIIASKVGNGYTPLACKKRARQFPPEPEEEEDEYEDD
ncbi:hypothetical protein N7513_012845 [Penicillium frequentans]|nr:hypothetical protein N7513_012845 [Penicillium glabrum]